MGGLLKEQGLEVIGGAASAAEALQQIAELQPDVALIDISNSSRSRLRCRGRRRGFRAHSTKCVPTSAGSPTA
jgi:DNA-binding NarL/FixJ family response regulator